MKTKDKELEEKNVFGLMTKDSFDKVKKDIDYLDNKIMGVGLILAGTIITLLAMIGYGMYV